MHQPAVRFNVTAVAVMTVGVILLATNHLAWGVGLFLAGCVLAVLAGHAAARAHAGVRISKQVSGSSARRR